MGDSSVKSDENKKILYMDATDLFGHSLSQPLPYDDNEIDKNVKLEEILITPGGSDIGYFFEVDLR